MKRSAFTSIRPRSITRRAAKKIGANTLRGGSLSGFFGKRGGVGNALKGAFKGNVKAAPNGLGSVIQNISQTVGGGDQSNVVNINKFIQQKVSDALSKTGSLSAQVQMPQLDGILNAFGGIADYMRSLADPSALSDFSRGIDSINESLEKTTDLVVKVRSFIKKLVKDLGKVKGGGGGGLGLGAAALGLGAGGLAAGGGKKGLLKKGGGALAKFFGGKKGKLLLGLGGLGLIGSGAASAAEGRTGEPIEVPPAIPEEDVNVFNKTVDDFQKFVKKLLEAPPKDPGKGSEQKPAPSSSTPASSPMSAGPSGPTPGVTTPEAKAAIQTITQLEGTSGPGGYSRWFGDRQGEMKYGDITGKTLKEVDDLQTRFLQDPQSEFTDRTGKKDRSAAVGAGQFTFLLDHARRMDPNVDITKQTFSEEYQNRLMMFLAKERGVDLNKPLTEADMTKLGGVWASMTPQYNQTSRTAAQSLQVYNANLKKARTQGAVLPQTPETMIDPAGPQSSAATSPETIGTVAQVPQTQVGQNNIQVINTGMGDQGSGQIDPSNVPAPSVAANTVPFHMPYDEDNMERLGTISLYNLISAS